MDELYKNLYHLNSIINLRFMIQIIFLTTNYNYQNAGKKNYQKKQNLTISNIAKLNCFCKLLANFFF